MTTECELFELGEEAKRTALTDGALDDYLDSLRAQSLESQLIRNQSNQTERQFAFRIFFVHLIDAEESDRKTGVGHKLSMEQETAIKLFETIQANPHFLNYLFGDLDYVVPHNTRRLMSEYHYEFMCQYHRSHLYPQQKPCSVYSKYDSTFLGSTHIIVSHKGDELVQRFKTRLTNLMLSRTAEGPRLVAQVSPFYLNSILCCEALAELETRTQHVHFSVSDVSRALNKYLDKPYNDESVTKTNRELHRIRRDSDSLLSGCEMLATTVRCSGSAYSELKEANKWAADEAFSLSLAMIDDSLGYLMEAVEQQMRFLHGCRCQRDTISSLLQSWVRQHDSAALASTATMLKILIYLVAVSMSTLR